MGGATTAPDPLKAQYLTDGKRLVMLLFIDARGCFVVEDAVTDERLVLPPAAADPSSGAWRSVTPASDDAAL